MALLNLPPQSPILNKMQAPKPPTQTASALDAFGNTPQPTTNVGNKAIMPTPSTPKPTLPKDQVAPNTGMVGSPTSLDYGSAIQRYQSYDPSQDPNVLAAQQRQRDAATQYGQSEANAGTVANPFGYVSNLMGIEGAQYGNIAPVLASQVTQAQTGASQKQSTLAGAAGLLAPHWNGYAGLNPVNNQPIGGSDASGTSLPAIATWGANIDYAGTAASNVKQYQTSIATARSQGETLVNQLQNTPDYNTDPINVWNSLKNFLQKNVSNPKYANIETSLQNVMSGYAAILGQDTMTQLVQGSQAPSLASFLQNLDTLAQKKIEETQNIGLGYTPQGAPNYGSVTAPTQPTIASQPPSFTRPNGQVVYLQADGTYQ